jgi:2-methylcitrate dehydratase PrpD
MSGQITINSTVLQSLSAMLAAQASAVSVKPAKTITIFDRERAALHVLDWLGCAYGAYDSSNANNFLFATPLPKSTIVPIERRATTSSPRADLQVYSTIGGGFATHWFDALQHNASLGNVLEMDDLHRSSILHPGPVIIPAAIVAAQSIAITTGRPVSGAQLLDAIVRGYEATIRIGRALGASHYKFYHNTSTCGAFGAAAAAASLFGANSEQMCWALANAGSRTGGLWQMRFEATDTKSLHNVMAAQTGVQAAMLAMRGVRGPASLLEGVCGLFAATAPDGDVMEVMRGAGEEDWLMHAVSFKPWPACRHAHPAIDAAIAVQLKLPSFSVQVIQQITLKTYKAAIDFCDKPNPTTVAEAKFSLQHAVAATFVAVEAGALPWLDSFTVKSIVQPNVAALRSRVVVLEDTAYTSAFPNRYGAEIEVVLNDGSRFWHQQLVAVGDPELPLNTQQISQKAANLMASQGVTQADFEVLQRSTQALAAPAHAATTVADFVRSWPKPNLSNLTSKATA